MFWYTAWWNPFRRLSLMVWKQVYLRGALKKITFLLQLKCEPFRSFFWKLWRKGHDIKKIGSSFKSRYRLQLWNFVLDAFQGKPHHQLTKISKKQKIIIAIGILASSLFSAGLMRINILSIFVQSMLKISVSKTWTLLPTSPENAQFGASR